MKVDAKVVILSKNAKMKKICYVVTEIKAIKVNTKL